VTERVIELRFLGRVVATHRLVPPGSDAQWLPEHKTVGEAIVLGRRRLHAVCDEGKEMAVAAGAVVELEAGDYHVEVPDLAVMSSIGPYPDTDLPVDIASERNTDDGCGCTGVGK
jgi:hypothetical protein